MKRTNENGWYAVTERGVMQLYDSEECSVCPISEEDLLCFGFTEQRDWVAECAEEIREKDMRVEMFISPNEYKYYLVRMIRKHLPTNKYNE